MAGYRDNLEATRAQAEALERELADLKSGKERDEARIAALERMLAAERARQYVSPPPPPPVGPYGYARLPSNATTVLVLGIASIMFCALLGPFAWGFGSNELARIDAGQSDPAKRSEAVAGRILGMISTSLMIIGVVCVLALLLFAQSWHAHF
jgi:hypothetical protein